MALGATRSLPQPPESSGVERKLQKLVGNCQARLGPARPSVKAGGPAAGLPSAVPGDTLMNRERSVILVLLYANPTRASLSKTCQHQKGRPPPHELRAAEAPGLGALEPRHLPRCTAVCGLPPGWVIRRLLSRFAEHPCTPAREPPSARLVISLSVQGPRGLLRPHLTPGHSGPSLDLYPRVSFSFSGEPAPGLTRPRPPWQLQHQL